MKNSSPGTDPLTEGVRAKRLSAVQRRYGSVISFFFRNAKVTQFSHTTFKRKKKLKKTFLASE